MFRSLYRFWNYSALRVILLISISWTFFQGTHCKPLQQQSNDRLSIGDDDRSITNVYDIDRQRSEKLSRTMDALAQFRQMLNNRLLTKNRLTPIDNDDEENFDEQQGERTVQRTPTVKHKNQKNDRYQPRRRQQNVGTPFQREQRAEDSELQTNTYQVHGLQIKAHLQQENSPSSRETPAVAIGQRGGEERDQRFMTGRTTAIDEQQLRSFTDLTQSDFECPRLNGKTTQVLCPSRRRHGYRVCIPDTALCNDRIDCPNGEDEEPVNCLFYKTTIHHFRLVVDAVVELSDLVKQQQLRRNSDEL